MVADLIIGFRIYREKFTSYVDLNKEALEINVNYADGPFKYLNNSLGFPPHPDGCEIDFHVDFEFQSTVPDRDRNAVFRSCDADGTGV